jgi:hypothetical protein
VELLEKGADVGGDLLEIVLNLAAVESPQGQAKRAGAYIARSELLHMVRVTTLSGRASD